MATNIEVVRRSFAVHRGADAVADRLEELTDLLPTQLEILDAIAVGEDEVFDDHPGPRGGRQQCHSGRAAGEPPDAVTDGEVSRWRWFMSAEEGRAAAALSS